jgi:hypothetical protein
VHQIYLEGQVQGRTRGYRNHPQLLRFRQTTNPPGAIATYLRAIATEAEKRGYRFDRSKIAARYYRGSIAVATGQLRYEFTHLLNKLATRDQSRHEYLLHSRRIYTHPLFNQVKGGIAEWEVL